MRPRPYPPRPVRCIGLDLGFSLTIQPCPALDRLLAKILACLNLPARDFHHSSGIALRSAPQALDGIPAVPTEAELPPPGPAGAKWRTEVIFR